MNSELLPDDPSDLETEPIEPNEASDLDFEDLPCTDDLVGDSDDDDSRWEVFIPDEDERDPEPELSDFCGVKEEIVAFDTLLVSPAPCLLI